VLPIYDALFDQKRLHHILVRHEQGAVHAAEGYARSTGKVGCVLVTSGPGATNAVTGLTDALCDSIPLVCITVTGADPPHRQRCVPGMRPRSASPGPARNTIISSKTSRIFRACCTRRFTLQRAGGPARSWSTSPRMCRFASGLYSRPNDIVHQGYRPRLKGDPAKIKNAIELMQQAKRPLFYTGGGVVINSGPDASRTCAIW